MFRIGQNDHWRIWESGSIKRVVNKAKRIGMQERRDMDRR